MDDLKEIHRLSTEVRQSIEEKPTFIALIDDQAFLGVSGKSSLEEVLDRFPPTELAKAAKNAPPLMDMAPLEHHGPIDSMAFHLYSGKGASRADLRQAQLKKIKKQEKKADKKDKKKEKKAKKKRKRDEEN